MADIFICYRRNDSEGYAGRLHDHLVERFGARAVFVDVDNLHPGQDFDQVIQRTLQRSSVVLVVIGRHWMDQRLKNEGDYVRREIIGALKSRKRLIPVLVGDAQMPSSDKLPPELAPLAGKNAITLRHSTWKVDVGRLIASLQRTLSRKKTTAVKRPAEPPRKSRPDKPAGAKKKDGSVPRRPARAEQGGNEAQPRKPTPRRGKKAPPAASPPRASQAGQRGRADAAAESAPSKGKARPGGKPADGAASGSAPRKPRGKKPPGTSAPRSGGGGGGRPGGSGEGKSAAKAPAPGGRRRKK